MKTTKHVYQIEYYDYTNGATSPIDVVHTNDPDYTAEKYIDDVRKNADPDYIDMIDNGRIDVIKIR